jgi:hypothetical protein
MGSEEAKPVVQSKTIWLNAVGGIVAPWLAWAQGALPMEAAIATSILAAVNFGLRFITKQPVALNPY